MKFYLWIVISLLASIPFISFSKSKEGKNVYLATIQKTEKTTTPKTEKKTSDNPETPKENLPAHVHGLGSLSIAVDSENSALEMEYLVPAHDVLGGFEHAPTTEEEKRVYEEISASLKSPLNIFQLIVKSEGKKADCNMDYGTIVNPYQTGKHEGEAHKEHHHHDEHEHADYKMKYSFHCKDINQLKGVKTLLFDKFPLLKQLQVVVIDSNGARPLEINKASPNVYFNEAK